MPNPLPERGVQRFQGAVEFSPIGLGRRRPQESAGMFAERVHLFLIERSYPFPLPKRKFRLARMAVNVDALLEFRSPFARRRRMGWYSFQPYVSVAQKRVNAAKEIAKLRKKGQKLSSVTIDGNKIARTFWGKGWCDNLESYSDYDNRLPRGRSYVRNGSVIDLQINAGCVTALVNGSSLYKVKIDMQPLAATCWSRIKRDCAGQIGSLIELLQGKLSSGVMGVITRADGGLFPKPNEIKKTCSCPDWADMCKHVAAALYAVGARLDQQPELLFVLRQVDHLDLITQAADVSAITNPSTGLKTIAGDQLADVFGIELEAPAAPEPSSALSLKQTRAPKARRPKIVEATSTSKLRDKGQLRDRPATKSRAGRGDKGPKRSAGPDARKNRPKRPTTHARCA